MTGLGSVPALHVPALTSLRFLAALMVMFGHSVGLFYSDFSPRVFNSLLGFANMGMSLFFILSGFVITYNYGSLGTLNAHELKRFAVARVARIYPLYLALLLLNVAIWGAALVTPVGLIAHLSLTQAWFFHSVKGVPLIQQFPNTAIAWSISAEWFCYLLFPAICVWLDRISRPLFAMVLVWAAILGGMYGIHLARPTGGLFVEWLGYYSPYGRIGEFAMGCLLCRLALSLPTPTGAERRIVAPIMVLAALAWLTVADESFTQPGGLLSTLRWCGGYAPGVAAVIFCCFRYGGSWLDNRWFENAGDSSYSFYLIHPIVLLAFLKLMPTPTPSVLRAALTIAAAMGVNLALSLFIYRWFERPTRNLVRQAFGVRRVSPAPSPAEKPDQPVVA